MRQLKSRSEEVASAVLGNANTRIVFRVGDQDSKALAEGFSFFDAGNLQNLGIGEAIARIERPDFDFNLRTSPIEAVPTDLGISRRDAVIDASRANFAIPKEEIEAQLRSASAVEEGEVADKPQTPKRASWQLHGPGNGRD